MKPLIGENLNRVPASDMKLGRPGFAILLLFAFFAFFLVLTPVLTGLIGKACARPEAAIRISMVVQDVLVFVLPAIGTAILCTRLPARLLAVEKWPTMTQTILAIAVLICSVPMMNFIVEWNKGWHLPGSMADVEAVMRQMEEAAESVTATLMAGASVGSLLISILIIGVLAGFSEELFFRGAMQRIFMCTYINVHVAIWLVAFIFSTFHFQFFGFVPRLLLGAYFGYLLWWSKSLWLPIILHVLNNSLVVYFTWRLTNFPGTSINPDTVGTDLSSISDIVWICVSVASTAVLLMALWRSRSHSN